MKVCCIILARGGSKGLKNKNILDVCGKPLLAYTIEASLSSKNIDRTIVSTDSKKIAEVAERYGAEVPFLRPSLLSNDSATSEVALQHALIWLEDNEQYYPDIIVYLQPTDLFRTIDMIENCVDELIADSNLDSVFVGHVTHKNFWKIDSYGKFQPLNDENYSHLPRQEKPMILREDTGLALATRSKVIHGGSRIGKNVKILPYESETNFVDIHSQFDLDLTKVLIKDFKKSPNKEI